MTRSHIAAEEVTLETLNSQAIRNMLPVGVKRRAGEVLAAVVATLLVAAVYANGSKSGTDSPLQEKAAPRLEQGQDAQEEEQRIGDFMQKVARAHVGRLDPQEHIEEHADKAQIPEEKTEPKTTAALSRKTASAGKSERPRVAALTQKPAPASAAAPVAAPAVPPAEGKEAQPQASLTSRVIDSVTGVVTSQNKRIMDGFSYVTNAVVSLAKR